ncbi:hypothetical protein Clacol_004814 [Clathrus columnatus]|uniref:ATP-dependent RNA helicase n=1 Tax=Clathrus columnatus TaxID=1419009 RepID=A0AAV5AAH6_9AGAM|nr:hypothetical protein Clacol_004814 [Clathrus columnatus]
MLTSVLFFSGNICLRYATTATATATATIPQAHKSSSRGSLESENADQVPFATLKGTMSYETLQAITVKPFKHQTMTAVQSRVLSLLPDLIRPHNPEEQDKTLPPRDMMVKARTGTGKTLAFLVPVIEARLRAIKAAGKQAVQDAALVTDKNLEGRVKRVFTRTNIGALIISPTRELATQIANEALRLSYHHDGFEVRLFSGGLSRRTQMRDFMKGRRDIVVATTGRLLDLANSEPEIKAALATTEMLILDEADTLLEMGFREDIDQIKEFLPPSPQRQTFLFSATISPAIRQIARSTLSPGFTFIDTIGANDVPVHARIPQYHTVLPSAADQISHVLRLVAHDQLTNPGKSKVMIFLPTTKMTQLFSTMIRELKSTALPGRSRTNVYEIHSKRTNDSRVSTSEQFRNDKSGVSVLVTSDVSARGVDYPGVTRVIQVGIPPAPEQYIHRIGRTGRAGTGGRGDLVLLPWEVGFVTWQLTDIPLKPITTNELKSQLETLAEKYDENPAVIEQDESSERVRHPRSSGRDARTNEKLRRIEGLPKGQKDIAVSISSNVEALLPNLEEEAIKETFASLLGYYMSKSPELRVQKGVIVQGCKDWTTGACGLEVPPYVSAAFLEKLGFSDGRTKRFGHSYEDRSAMYSAREHRWSGRGSQRSRDKAKAPPRYANAESEELDPEDPVSDPSEFKTPRYGRSHKERSNYGESRDFRGGRDFQGDRQFGGDRDFTRKDRDFGGNQDFKRDRDFRGNQDFKRDREFRENRQPREDRPFRPRGGDRDQWMPEPGMESNRRRKIEQEG